LNQAAGRDSHATACSETIVTVVAVIVAALALWFGIVTLLNWRS